MSEYQRYRIEAEQAPNLADHPSRFRVRMNKPRLAGFLLKEFVHYRGNLPVILSRPCVYGVFSGPIGGFAPRDNLCVGCLRCTVQYPDMVQIEPNPERLLLGDSYISPDQVDTLLYESSTGRVPVKGAGYRGAYGGPGWDSMWTDMSEIVRPTRDGIHGREFISTVVDLGARDSFIEFDEQGQPLIDGPIMLTLPVPIIFDAPPKSAESKTYLEALVAAADAVESLVVLPLRVVQKFGLRGPSVVPLASSEELEELSALDWAPRMIEVEGIGVDRFNQLSLQHPEAVLCLRLPFEPTSLVDLAQSGVGCFHLTADYHGETEAGFVMEAIQQSHQALVSAGLREQVTLIGSGGIAAAEHTPKAIISGLDAVAIETAPLLALQARFQGEVRRPEQSNVDLPELEANWARQRLVNLIASWRDQMLEILGAMGLREVRRLRGEVGRAMSQNVLEEEAFAGIEGFGDD